MDLCGWGHAFATRYTYGVGSVGVGSGGAMPDIANSGVLILWGYNPTFTRITHATAAIAARKRGMRLIVIDPRHIGLAGRPISGSGCGPAPTARLRSASPI
jgi:anaerobic selenocysteine-containing dehydrogenase